MQVTHENLRRMSLLRKKIGIESSNKAALDELAAWCNDVRAYRPETQQGLIDCISTARQHCGKPGYSVSAALNLFKASDGIVC